MLNSAVVSAWLWVHVGILLVVVAYATLGNALFPVLAERARGQLARSLPATLGAGIGLSLLVMIPAIVMINIPNGVVKFGGAVLAVGFIAIALLGLAPLAMHVGSRGDTSPNANTVRWTTVARGAAIIALTWMLPFVGWFVALPLSLACGAGCLMLSAWRSRAPALAA
jgi:hypothetical protein